MSEKEITINENFKEDLELIDKTIDEVEALYEETKSHFESVKDSRARGSLPFIHLQTANLISLKNSKLSLVKERVNIKKLKAELELKQIKSGMDEQSDKQIIQDLMREILLGENLPSMEDEDEKIEKRINSLEKKGKIKFNENEKALSTENDDIVIAVLKSDKKWKFVGVNERNEIVKGHPVPKKNDFKIKIKRSKKGDYAYDQEGKIYPLIEK